MRKIAGVVLAAGKGTRMKSNLVKALHPLMGVPMLSFLLESLRKVAPELIVVVAGYQGEEIRERFKGQGLVFVEQEDQLGTGHAVLCAREALKDFEGDVLLFLQCRIHFIQLTKTKKEYHIGTLKVSPHPICSRCCGRVMNTMT